MVLFYIVAGSGQIEKRSSGCPKLLSNIQKILPSAIETNRCSKSKSISVRNKITINWDV
jgi:hypothetical protein